MVPFPPANCFRLFLINSRVLPAFVVYSLTAESNHRSDSLSMEIIKRLSKD